MCLTYRVPMSAGRIRHADALAEARRPTHHIDGNIASLASAYASPDADSVAITALATGAEFSLCRLAEEIRLHTRQYMSGPTDMNGVILSDDYWSFVYMSTWLIATEARLLAGDDHPCKVLDILGGHVCECSDECDAY